MLKARLLQPSLQPQPSCVGPRKPSQRSYGFETPKVDAGEGCGCRVLQPEKEKPNPQPSGSIGPFRPQDQEEKEPGRMNGDLPVPRLNSSSLASSGRSSSLGEATGAVADLLPSEPSQEWKVVKIQRVLLSPVGQPRKANLSRSASLSEKELKEAKARSQRIAAQLATPPCSNSKGVLLFHRRKQRVNEFTSESLGSSRQQAAGRDGPRALPHGTPHHGTELSLSRPAEGSREPGGSRHAKYPGLPARGDTMEAYEENAPLEKPRSSPGNGEEMPSQASTLSSLEGSPGEDVPLIPLSVYLKETTEMAATNGVHEPDSGQHAPLTVHEKSAPDGLKEMEQRPAVLAEMHDAHVDKEKNGEVLGMEQPMPAPEKEEAVPAASPETTVPGVSKEQNGAPKRQYCEVHLTLAKPKPVKNRTARPFGTQSSAVPIQPAEKPPAVDLPEPPTYTETLSSPPPVTRVWSPPAYSALYPSPEQKPLVIQSSRSVESKSGPVPKTGVLEESVTRRGNKKSMFTFVEKPKLGPNPDLLNLVQNADSRKKQKDHGEPAPEEEPFALGAEASNFLHENAPKAGPHLAPADNPPAWSSCLRSPRIQPKPKIKPTQSLTEAKGKGAELFARRQSRMEKYVIESPAHPRAARSPSPTMSLPPSWKYDPSMPVSPMVSRHAVKSPSRPAKTPPASLYSGYVTESEIAQKELEISKQQPYQLQPSLFILSPSKDPLRSLPRGAPPPKPMPPDPQAYTRQTSCPTAPLPPSPVLHPPALSTSSRPMSRPFSATIGTVPMTQDIRASARAPLEVPVASPSRVLLPAARGVFQAPRPSYSTRSAGIEAQDRRSSLPTSPTCAPRFVPRMGSLDGWLSPTLLPEPEESLAELRHVASPPPPPMSPAWSDRSLSPLRQEPDLKASRQMQARLARNIINAARRKSSSPKAPGTEGIQPFTPPTRSTGSPCPSPLQSLRLEGPRQASTGPPGAWSPTEQSPLQSPRAAHSARAGASSSHGNSLPAPKAAWMDGHRVFVPAPNAGGLPASTSACPSPGSLAASSLLFKTPPVGTRSPAKPYASRSPTDSDVSLDSEDSGAKSPGIRSFNICPRGWNGSLRLKRASLPSEAPCTS
ncbi:synaptopodin isoform X1 [Alligator mississippiensis]|uniref:synaptopodin isoform X1 n=1 Tax=Alligator mississippiensis TaxID=8496 RepID=UPI0028773D4D|nr:synaptopodin isoform X1 [Alligator mississippiensis]XP_019334973.2 synaptopodin isoform X1 [Alligator mississippiensis]XP_059568904.1 synaptopodin isoform X1 [Alligator mississippiensis]